MKRDPDIVAVRSSIQAVQNSAQWETDQLMGQDTKKVWCGHSPGHHQRHPVWCCRQTQQVQAKQADKDKALKERAETGKGPDITQGVANDNINKDTFK